MEEINIPKHLNPNSSQYKMLMRRYQTKINKPNETALTNNPVMGMTLTGVKEIEEGKKVSGLSNIQSSSSSSSSSGSGLKTINLNFRYKPKTNKTIEPKVALLDGGKMKLIV
jgi:hypothetical protein